MINLANGVAGDTLTIDGDYVSGGGEWRLDASLTGTGATVTDQVIITGDTVDMGADRIRVDNLALTDPTGLESVRLIRVDGISAASFVLLSRVVQGAYEYVLSQHDDGGWYLDSFMHVSPDPVPPVVPVPPVDPTPPVGPIIPAEPLDPGDPTDPVDPSDPVDPVPPVDPEDPLDPVDPVDPGDPVDPTPPTDPVDPTVPIPPALPEDPADPPDPVTPPPAPLIRPEIGAHAANLLGATELIGMSRADRDGAMRIGRGAWFQIQRQTGSISTENDQLDTDFSRHSLLAGADLLRFSTNGRDDVVIGAMAGYGRQSSDTVSALTGFATDAELTGHALGVYAAWAEQPGGAHGWYVDGWASLGRFDAEIEGEGFDPLDYDLSVARLSLEAGYGFEIWQNGRAGITLQPQAQLTLSHIGSERFTDNSGARIRMGGNAMQSRLGLRAAYRQAASTAFLQLDWLRWLDRPELRIDDYRADQGGKDALRVGLGYQHRWSDRGQAEFRVDHTDLSDGNSLATSLKLNYRF